ncbi:MAG: hypothetical protein ACK5P7_12035 [Bdellovibrio sp.]
MVGFFSFFSFLFPAWKFFSQTGTVFRIEARWENGPPDWQQVFRPEELPFKFWSFLYDEPRLSHLLAYSLVERLAQQPDKTESPSLQLLIELIGAVTRVRVQDPSWIQVRLWTKNPLQGQTSEALYFESDKITRTGDVT